MQTPKFINSFEKNFRKGSIAFLGTPLLIITVVEVLNAIWRKSFVPLPPFPCAIEIVESLMVVCIYFGVTIVAIDRGNVNVILFTRKLSVRMQHYFDAFANFIGFCAYIFIGVGACMRAVKSVEVMEIRVGAYIFPIWPFRIMFAIGLLLLSFQLLINIYKSLNMARGKIDAG